MRKLLILALSAFVIVASLNAADYDVSGEVDGLDGVTFYLKDLATNQILDSAVVENGKVHFTGSYPDSAFVTIFNNVDNNVMANCILDGIAVVDFNKHYPIIGSKLNCFYRDLRVEQKEGKAELRRYKEDLKSQGLTDDEIHLILKQDYEKKLPEDHRRSYDMAISNDNGLGVIGLLYFLNSPIFTKEEWWDLYEKLPPYVKGTRIAQLRNSIFLNEESSSEGSHFIDFTAKDVSGNPVKLSDYIGKGKYVLVDFWASWCVPCRREAQDVLMPMYEKYKDNISFEIVGVAIGDKPENTLRAISEAGYQWTQLIDTGDQPGKLYAIEHIPTIILFAPDGTILKRGLRGEVLTQTIDELLSYPCESK